MTTTHTPAPELVARLARELWAAGEPLLDACGKLLPDACYRVAAFDDLAVADAERFLELADTRIRADKQYRAVCPGWKGVHAEPIVLHAGIEPVSHGMCADCARAFVHLNGEG